MKKKLIVTIIVLLFAILLTGCSSEEAQKNAESFLSGLNSVTRDPSVAFSQEAEIQTTENQFIFVWTDPDTKIQYIVYRQKSGYAGFGGITPRLNADGSLYISED